MDEKIKAAEATPKREVWRVCRGSVWVGNYPEGQYEKAADHLLHIFKPKFMEEAAGYVKKPYGTETFRRELPSIEINANANLLLGHSEQEITKRVYRRIGA
eukprot:gene18659-18529_t